MQRCTDRGNELSVPLQHHVDVLHHTQQVEEATTEGREEKSSYRGHKCGNSYNLSGVETLPTGHSYIGAIYVHYLLYYLQHMIGSNH